MPERRGVDEEQAERGNVALIRLIAALIPITIPIWAMNRKKKLPLGELEQPLVALTT